MAHSPQIDAGAFPQITGEAGMVPLYDWPDSFGAQLTRLRHDRHLTQEQLAHRSGMSVRAISSLECGARHPRRLTVERLATGLGLAPRERHELLDAVRTARPPVPDPPSGTPLTGRDSELAVLRAHLRGGGPPLLCLVGEPGIGKSRLLAEATALGSPALTGACRRGGGLYAPVVDALAAHARNLPARVLAALDRDHPGLSLLLPELCTAPTVIPAGQHRRLAFDAATRFLRASATGGAPVTLVLDDLQWAGPPTAELVAHLVRHAGTALRVVIAVRAGDVALTSRLAQCLADLSRLDLVRHHQLAPLSPAGADLLVTRVAGDAPLAPAVRRDIVRRSGGLPLFLVELTRAAAADGCPTVPGSLRLAVQQQLADLPAPLWPLLQRIAVAGAVVPLERLAPDPVMAERVLVVLDAAVGRGVLAETRCGFRFRNPLMREVVAHGLGPTRRRLWRRPALA